MSMFSLIILLPLFLASATSISTQVENMSNISSVVASSTCSLWLNADKSRIVPATPQWVVTAELVWKLSELEQLSNESELLQQVLFLQQTLQSLCQHLLW